MDAASLVSGSVNTPAGDPQFAKIKEAIDKSSNILIALKQNPTTDEIAAAVGLFDILEKFEKFPTAIFSGELPEDLKFLGVNEVFQKTTDSLRDFIIYLDKNKADRVRSHEEGESVKIYITPYRTKITEQDINFTQGDYNIDLVFTLGAVQQNDLDTIISGEIAVLHDATVIALNDSAEMPGFATINYQNTDGSGISEIVAQIGETLEVGVKPYLDQAIATALLTGIIARTEQFTVLVTAKTMQIAGKLIAAGADTNFITVQLQNDAARANIAAAQFNQNPVISTQTPTPSFTQTTTPEQTSIQTQEPKLPPEPVKPEIPEPQISVQNSNSVNPADFLPPVQEELVPTQTELNQIQHETQPQSKTGQTETDQQPEIEQQPETAPITQFQIPGQPR